jgi:hypothetical protein
VLESDKIYNTDGPQSLLLISFLLPQKAGVGFEEQFKWKPAGVDNTIDFFVTFEKLSKLHRRAL